MSEQSISARLETLRQRRADGVVTQAEFETAAATLLAQQAAGEAANSGRNSRYRGSLHPAPDDYLGWMILPLRRYADFSGRSPRQEFWMFQVVILLFAGVAVALLTVGAGLGLSRSEQFQLANVLSLVTILILVLPSFALQVRRFHDLGQSGWFVLFNLLPFAGSMAVCVMMAREGMSGTNRFGPDPMARRPVA